jgi:hypothetical protein
VKLAENSPDLGRALPIEKVRAKLMAQYGYGYVLLESNCLFRIAIGRSLLFTLLLYGAETEDETFLFAYYANVRCAVFRVGDVIAVSSIID